VTTTATVTTLERTLLVVAMFLPEGMMANLVPQEASPVRALWEELAMLGSLPQPLGLEAGSHEPFAP